MEIKNLNEKWIKKCFRIGTKKKKKKAILYNKLNLPRKLIKLLEKLSFIILLFLLTKHLIFNITIENSNTIIRMLLLEKLKIKLKE